MNIFGMMPAAAPDPFAALRSFLACTPAAPGDRVYLVHGTGDGVLPDDLRGEVVSVYRDSSGNFSTDANILLAEARRSVADVFLLGADLLFTPGWRSPFATDRPTLMSPMSNDQVEYPTGGPVDGQARQLAAIAQEHRSRHDGYQAVAWIDNACVRIPRAVYDVVGDFDERFTGRDAAVRDYGLRACLAGFTLELASSSYVLHLPGADSATRHPAAGLGPGPASPDAEAFERKWGSALAHVWLGGGWNLFLSDRELGAAVRRKQFRAIAEQLRAQPSLEPFATRQLHARFAAVCCIYDDDAWLVPTMESAYDACDSIWFLVNERPWHGEASDQAPLIRKIEALSDPSKKLRIVRGCWETEAIQRNEGLRLLARAGLEYCFVLDADEIYDPVQLAAAMDHARRRPQINCWRMPWYTYWKSAKYRIDPVDPSSPVVFMRVGAGLFVDARQVKASHQAVVPIDIAAIHHMSYARTDAQIRRKITTFSHAGEIIPGWYEDVWLRWDADPSIENLNPCWPRLFARVVEQPPDAQPPVLRRWRNLAESGVQLPTSVPSRTTRTAGSRDR